MATTTPVDLYDLLEEESPGSSLMPSTGTDSLAVNAQRVIGMALTWPDRARACVVTSRETYRQACDLLMGIKDLRLRIADTFDKHIQRAHEAHKALVGEKKQAEAPLTEAETIIKRGLVTWEQEQERARQAEQARQDALAREAEAARRLEEAAALELVGHQTGDADMVDTAQTIMAAPIQVAAGVVKSDVPSVRGVSYRTTYSARVTDLHALVRWVASNPQYLHLLTANQTALNGLARAQRTALALPGVVVDEKRDAAVRIDQVGGAR